VGIRLAVRWAGNPSVQRNFALGLLLVCVTAVLSGCAVKSLAANDAFSYACAAGGECAVYLTVTNPSRQDDRLVGARSDVAARTELHKLIIDDEGVLAMQQVASVLVPAADTVEFKPGSLHIMLFELKRELKAGETFELTLLYEREKESTVEVLVMPEN
jgi:periplasmic copper chaperone A